MCDRTQGTHFSPVLVMVPVFPRRKARAVADDVCQASAPYGTVRHVLVWLGERPSVRLHAQLFTARR